MCKALNLGVFCILSDDLEGMSKRVLLKKYEKIVILFLCVILSLLFYGNRMDSRFSG